MTKVDAYFINVSTALSRREKIEDSYRHSGFSDDWSLTRFEALTPASPLVLVNDGSATDKLKANYLSHIECARAAIDSDNHLLIAEDDTIFCGQTEAWANQLFTMLPEAAWDVIFADIYVADSTRMPKLLRIRHSCMTNNRLMVYGAEFWDGPWAGAGCYIINKRSKEKFVKVLETAQVITPFDLALREATRSRLLNGVIVFPFITSVSDEADKSQVRAADDMIETTLFHYFRRLIWVGAQHDEDSLRRIKEEIARLVPTPPHPEVDILNAIMGPLLSLQLHWPID